MFTLITPEMLSIDYSKAEFKTFCHVWTDDKNEEHADLYEYDGFKALCAELKNGALIFKTVIDSIGKIESRYVGFNKNSDGSLSKQYFEIQWD